MTVLETSLLINLQKFSDTLIIADFNISLLRSVESLAKIYLAQRNFEFSNESLYNYCSSTQSTDC